MRFSKSEILQIYHLKARGMKDVDIERKTGRSRAGIYQSLSKDDNFETKLRFGRTKKTTKLQDREISRSVSIQYLSVLSSSREVTVSVLKSTVLRRLHSSELFHYRKMHRTSNLTKRHKHARVQWARNHTNWSVRLHECSIQ